MVNKLTYQICLSLELSILLVLVALLLLKINSNNSFFKSIDAPGYVFLATGAFGEAVGNAWSLWILNTADVIVPTNQISFVYWSELSMHFGLLLIAMGLVRAELAAALMSAHKFVERRKNVSEN